MKFKIMATGKFKKDLKVMIKRECHITPDWLLIIVPYLCFDRYICV